MGYHHILSRDRTLLYFLDQIGTLEAVRWRKIRMLFRVGGRLYDLGRPAGFLAFPMPPAADKLAFEPLTRLKFEISCEDTSAAWLGTRLHFREGSAPLGYIPHANWTKVLCDGVTRLVEGVGVRVRLRTRVARLHTRGDRVVEAELSDGSRLGATCSSARCPPRPTSLCVRTTRPRTWVRSVTPP